MDKCMDKNIAVYNNATGVAEIMGPLFVTEGFRMLIASGLEELLQIIEKESIQLMLVDVELDGTGWGSDIEMINCLRRVSVVPMIVISAQTAETAKIMALNAGADDYVTTGVSPLVLLARVKSQLRRYSQLMNLCGQAALVYRVGDLEVDDRSRSVTVEGREVKLTPIEYKILRLLIKERGKVFSISQIYEAIWQMKAVGVDNTIAVHIRHIREKIERNPQDPHYLKVVWGTGYKVG